jgi:hypothetical protein
MKRRVSLLAVLLLSLTLVTNSISIFATSESDPVSPTPIENENGNSVDDETNNDNSDENNDNPDNEETSGVVIPDDTSLLGNPPRPSETVSGNDNGSTFSLMSVSGGDLSTWAGYGFEDASNPPDDAVIFQRDSATIGDMDGVGSIGYATSFYSEGTTGYKILGYDGSSIITSTYDGVEKINSPLDKDLDTILAEYRYIDKADGVVVTDETYIPHLARIYTPYSDNCCFLIFKEDASSISDLLYKVSFSDVMANKYSGTDIAPSYDNSVPVGEPTIDVVLEEKLKADGTLVSGGKYKVNFTLPQVKLTDDSIVDDNALFYSIPERGYTQSISGMSGSFDFSFLTLTNGTYTLLIKTEAYQTYSVNFTVDYVEDYPADEPDDNQEVPQITFSPFPDGEHFDGEAIKMTMSTNNVRTVMTFNGTSLANGSYTNSAEFTISSNGTYHCVAVSAAGKVAETDLVVDFFKPAKENSIRDTSNDKLVSTSDDKLSQTGFGYSIVLYIFAILLICTGAFLLLNKKYNFLNMEVIKNAFRKK